MKAIESTRIAVYKRALAMLSWRQESASTQPAVKTLLGNDIETANGGYGLVITPAQDLAFFARSTAWRCTSCGKVHRFEERVAVVFASPCACTSIEFEPQRDDVLSGPEMSLPALLTQ